MLSPSNRAVGRYACDIFGYTIMNRHGCTPTPGELARAIAAFERSIA